MVYVAASVAGYEYDIRSMIQAFIANQEIKYKEFDFEYTSIDKHISEFDEDVLRERFIDEFHITGYEDDRIFYVALGDKKIDVFYCYEANNDSTSMVKSIYINDDSKESHVEKYNNYVKKAIYRLLSEVTGRILPWGILTGIRPTKLIIKSFEKNMNEDEIIDNMIQTYMCSPDKARLAYEVADNEMKLLNKFDYKNSYSLYIGIPFCPTTCLYCSFTSYSFERYGQLADAYLQSLYKEISYAAGMFKSKKLVTVYIGGGTPTTLSAEQLQELLSRVRTEFDMTNVIEFTVEAGRPDSITKDKLKVLKNNGVTRISINPQSMNQKTLDIIGRRHSVEQINKAFYLARTMGFDNINMDIILGLPGEGMTEVLETLRQIKLLSPDSLTVHTLAIKRAAYLNIHKERYIQMLPTHVSDMVERTMDYAFENDYEPYYLYRQKNMTDNLENIGYARAGKEGLYNILIMEEIQTILALGAGGVCKFIDYKNEKLERVDNVKSIKDYIERIGDMITKKEKFIQGKGAYYDEIY